MRSGFVKEINDKMLFVIRFFSFLFKVPHQNYENALFRCPSVCHDFFKVFIGIFFFNFNMTFKGKFWFGKLLFGRKREYFLQRHK